MKLHQLREQRSAALSSMKAIVDTAAAAGRDLTADESAKFDTLKAEERSLSASIERHEHLASLEARTAAPVGKDTAENLEGRVSLLSVLRAGMEGRSLTGAEAEYHQETERRTGRKAEGVFVPMGLLERRANTTGTAPELVPTDHRADQYIGPLREALLARRLGVRVLSGLRGNISIPKYGSGLETGWLAESGAVPDGEMSFGNVSLSPKHVGGKTELSRQLIQQSSPDIEALVRQDLAFLIARQIDRAIIAGSGTDNEPRGIINTVGIQTGDLSTLDYAAVMALVQKFEDTELTSAAWLTTSDAKTKFATTLKAAGLPGYLLENGQVGGYPLHVTRQFAADSNGDSPVLLGDFSQVLLGVWSELDILVNPFAEPAYSRGGVQVRAMATCDVALRYPEAFVLAEGV
ncbi:phage major capsid protein [Pseudomonas aeruginosa]|uniref:phage major capsid protein n=1 Tax=Pseudomonas aeruginosa TaxID=287 RepID=UPI002AB3B451|nr:phage major capsid protein [Pseudomonas aeruginosa]MDY7853023.1 phage major capsid protein [Pseudomonas aeruginosa]HBP5224327.1 phage major capsid protein [Pseudomonas aeruginosa]